MSQAREFDDRPAVREQVPLLLGLIGPSGTGKTFSALRLATGIQRVTGGDIFVIDTESRRSLHYADNFKFRHVPFGAPFSSLDYLAAIQHCVTKGAKTVIVDSMSHEHEGPGGVLEMHAAEAKRIAAAWKSTEEKAKLAAWNKPKSERRRLINTILQLPINCIFCFRAKEKLKIVKGADPEQLGFMPIAGEEFVYEMVLKCLLLPGANGFPTWQSEFAGERMMIKCPGQFRPMFKEGPQLSEDVGEALAKWAAGTGGEKVKVDLADLIKRYEACSEPATYRFLEEERKEAWSSVYKDDRAKLKAASDAAKERIEKAAASQAAEDDTPEPGSDG